MTSTQDSPAADTGGDQPAAPAARTRLPLRDRLAIAALVAAVAAVALSAWAAFQSTSESSARTDGAPVVDDAARSAATQRICDAFETVRRGVSLNTNASAPGGSGNAAGVLAVTANARLALLGGGQYLLSRLDPAVPTELGDSIRNLANTLLDIGATSISGVGTTNPVQADRLRAAEDLSAEVAAQCGES